MPEIEVYQSILKGYGIQVDLLRKATPKSLKPYQVEWHFMGIDLLPKVPNRLKIHEYASLPIPPFPNIKKQLKRFIVTQPDLRIFQTKEIGQRLGYKDGVPVCLRGPGIHTNFLNANKEEIQYDFVYTGAMDKVRKIEPFLNKILAAWPRVRILLIGGAPVQLKAKFESPTIHFTGKIPYQEVPKYLRKATYGLNLMPNIHPFNIQPSYKLIDYCAAGLKVITTSYNWAERFEQAHNARFFKLDQNGKNLHPSSLEEFPFITPDVSHLIWEKVLQESQLIPKLHDLLEKKNFKF